MTDFGNAYHPKARKDHKCIWCSEAIKKGEYHAQYKGKWEGEWQNWRMHDECYKYASENDYLGDGFNPYENERPTDLAQICTK